MEKIKQADLKVVYVDINDLKESEENPRLMTEPQEDGLTESMKRFGFADPLICNSRPPRHNVIVGGHQRLRVAKKLGYAKVPVIYLGLTPKQERELNIRLNKNTGQFDYEKLKEYFDVDTLIDLGFSEDELADSFAPLLSVENDDFDLEKEIQKAERKTTVKLGDLYQLGSNRLICGDSLDPEVIKRLMGGAKVDMVNFDPPYNIGLDYSGGLGGKANYGGDVNDKKPPEDYRKFVRTLLINSLAHAKPDCHVIVFNDEKHVGLLQDLYRELGIHEARLCAWVKGIANPTPQVAFNKICEWALYGTIGKPFLSDYVRNLTEIMNKEVEGGARMIDDILDALNLWLVQRLPANLYSHPTQKPCTLYEKALRRCTRPGDALLDVCGGSGSQLIAAEQLKRKAYLCEISPVFCQVILNRFNQLSNDKAKKLN